MEWEDHLGQFPYWKYEETKGQREVTSQRQTYYYSLTYDLIHLNLYSFILTRDFDVIALNAFLEQC